MKYRQKNCIMNYIKSVLLLIFISLTIVSCHSSKQYLQSVKSGDISYMTKAETSSEIKRKIITSVNLNLTVKNPDSANLKIVDLAKRYEGYFSRMGSDETIIRVKENYLSQVLEELSNLGIVKEKNIYGQDVTDEYLDNEIRLENAQKSRSRYLELLEKAKSVEEILKVEKELERLNETIDLIKGRMNRLVHLSAFSTITITFEEKKKPGFIGYLFVGAYKSIRWLFVRN